MSAIFLVLAGVALAGLFTALGTGLAGFGAFDPAKLDAHRSLAQFGAILVVFVHSVVFVYMIGTGRAIKDATREFRIDPAFYQRHVAFKWRAAPWALSCTVFTAAAAVLGAFAGHGGLFDWLHPLCAVLAMLCNLAGLPAEYRTIHANGALLEEVAAATAAVNRELIERGLDPAPPASKLSAFGWSLVLAASVWLPFFYVKYVMGRSGLSWPPFALASAAFLSWGGLQIRRLDQLRR